MLKKMVASAVFAGFAAGLIAAALQFAFVQPVLLEAELYETGALAHLPFGGGNSDATADGHDHGAHSHADAPAGDGGIDFARDGLSVLFTVFNYTAFGLILIAGFALAEFTGKTVTVRSGVLWGLAGFVALHFAPAIGLPPELPGTAAAEVIPRQIWWSATVVATGLGLWLVAFGAGWQQILLAVVLILAPHAVGAPHPAVFTGTPPPELASLFASRALGVGMAAWACLGLLAAYYWQMQADA